MTIETAIKRAMREFAVAKSKGDVNKSAEIRSIYLQEGSGSGRNWTELSIRVEYAVDGDYSYSDSCPYIAYISVK